MLRELISDYKNIESYKCYELHKKVENSKFYFTSNPFIKIINHEFEIQTQILGYYNAENIVASITIAKYFNTTNDAIKQKLENIKFQNNRSELIKTKHNTIILDAYNANPTSVKIAIKSFIELLKNQKHKQSLVILGDMLELGKNSKKYHIEILNLLKKYNLSNTILVGKQFYQVASCNTYTKTISLDECRAFLIDNNIKNTTILIKGSRGMQLEKLLNSL